MPVNTSGTAHAVINMGAVGILGTFLGMPLDALFLGALGGALINARSGVSGGRWGVAQSILVSALFAGAFSPVAVRGLLHVLPFAVETELRVAAAVLIGGCWSWAAPLLGDAVKRLLDTWTDLLAGWGKKK